MTAANTAAERLGAEYFQDPYSVHARLRAERPVSAVIMPGGMPAWLVTGYAGALPITVICELLGVPVADRDDFRAWSATIVSNTVTPEVFMKDATAMVRYIRALLAAKRQEPADDLLSALILARDEGDRLRENELVSMVFLLLVAGHETTVNLIASGTLALLLNPNSSAGSAPAVRCSAARWRSSCGT
jgi:cytochrome P450